MGRLTDAEGRARRGAFFGAIMLLVVYFLGSTLQSWNVFVGLGLTLWGVVMLPAIV